MECWASEFSPCQGRQSSEHYVSRGVLPLGLVRIRGLPFCGDETLELPHSAVKANILCAGHNSQLSTLDSEAKRLKAAIMDDATDAGSTSAPIRGIRVARWLAKTYCNFMVLQEQAIPSEFIELSFDAAAWRNCHCYAWFPMAGAVRSLGLRPAAREEHFQFNRYCGPNATFALVRFFGLRLILANFDARTLPFLDGGDSLPIDTRDLAETPPHFNLNVPGAGGRLERRRKVHFDWSLASS